MVQEEAPLVMLVKLVDRLPFPEPLPKRGRGRPKVYSDRLIVKALIIMIIRRLFTAYSLLAFLDQPTALTAQLRHLLTENGQFPNRRTWEPLGGAAGQLAGLDWLFGASPGYGAEAVDADWTRRSGG